MDGVKHEYEAKKFSATKPDGKTDGKAESKPEGGIVGTWDYSATTPNGSQDGKLVFKSEGGKITGVETSNGEDTDIKEVKVDGKTVTLSLDSEAGGSSTRPRSSGPVTGSATDCMPTPTPVSPH